MEDRTRNENLERSKWMERMEESSGNKNTERSIWMEREIKLMSMREELDDEDDDSCPLCCTVLKYILVIILVCFFLVVPYMMIYIGANYSYCEDMFAPWLLIGGVLCYVDYLILISKEQLKRHFSVNANFVYYVFLGFLVIIMIWWIFGFGRIFSGAMNTDPVMDDPVCKWYLYTFPFWLTLCPFVIFFLISFVFCCHNC